MRIDRDSRPRRRWIPWLVLLLVLGAAAAAYPTIREQLAERRAPEVEVARVTQASSDSSGPLVLPVLVASGYIVARRSSDVGVKVGGRIERLTFEEGTRVAAGQVIAQLERGDLLADLASYQARVAEAETQLAETIATRDEDARNLERQRALFADGIATSAALTSAEAAAQRSAARVETARAAIRSARAQVAVAEQAIENTNVRAPFAGVVIRKRAEVGETVSPFGVAGQGTREGGAIATIADLNELEVQTEVNESSVAKLSTGMPARVTVQAYPGREYDARVREIFPSADRAKAIVEVRVSILNPDRDVKPEMTASVTFQEERAGTATEGSAAATPSAPVVLAPKAAVSTRGGQTGVWVVTGNTVSRRAVTVGTERIDQVEVREGLAPGEAVVLNPSADLADGARVRVR